VHAVAWHYKGVLGDCFTLLRSHSVKDGATTTKQRACARLNRYADGEGVRSAEPHKALLGKNGIDGGLRRILCEFV
jgi:hypothetical protein